MVTKRNKTAKTKSGKATIYDIAREAKVSTGTVSRALNNSDEIKLETRRKILEISRRLGVRPRAPSKKRHYAVIVPSRVAGAPRAPIDVFVYGLLMELSNGGSALSAFNEHQMEGLQRGLFDGIFSVNWQPEVLEALNSIKNTPVIVLNRFQDQRRFSVVGWNHVAEGRTVANYFLDKGHKSIGALMMYPMNREANILRLSGMREACAAKGFPMQENLVELMEAGSPLYAALHRIVGNGADAVFVPGHGRYAMEVVNILQGVMRLKVPEDISVIGSDSPSWSVLTNPPLTSVTVPYAEIAAQAVELMGELIEQSDPAYTEERLLEVSLLERKSVMDRS